MSSSLVSDFLVIKNLSFELPSGIVLFANLNLALNKKKVALVGANGVGKSTLAKIMAEELQPSSGSIIKSKDVKYFAQIISDQPQKVQEFLQDTWEQAYFNPVLAENLLSGISLDQDFDNLSGGEQMRVRLLKTISESASLLILDEPSNNLDLASKEVLIQFLNDYPYGILLISHDRLLLSEVEQVLELSNQGLRVYGGNYQDYELEKSKEQSRQQAELAVLKKEKRKLKLELEEKLQTQEKRMRSGARAAEKGGMPKILLGARKRQAQQSLGKIQSNEQKRLEQGQKDLAQKISERKIQEDLLLHLPEVFIPANSLICQAQELVLTFKASPKDLWQKPLSFQIFGSDRVSIQGRNGSGKTSLLRFLTSKEDLTDLQAKQGDFKKIQRPYFLLNQSLSHLTSKAEEKVLDFIMSDSRFDQVETRNLMAKYQFYGQEVFKKIKDLSGGERLKLGLCHLYLTRLNYEVLILDEPTNNLDLQSLEILEKVLNSFKGSLIVISHDPIFLKNIGINKTIYLL